MWQVVFGLEIHKDKKKYIIYYTSYMIYIYIWVKLLRDLLATQRLNQNIDVQPLKSQNPDGFGDQNLMFPNHPVLGTHTF